MKMKMELKNQVNNWDKLKAYPLSNFDLINKLNLEPYNIFEFNKIDEVSNIDDLLDRHGRGIMLYLTENKNTGHWIAVLKYDNTIEIYDPYGNHPKQFEKNLVGGNDVFEQDHNDLINLIKKSGYKFTYNNHKHQSKEQNINTCGRHSIMRLIFSNFDKDEYNDIIKKLCKYLNITPDDLSILITENMEAIF